MNGGRLPLAILAALLWPILLASCSGLLAGPRAFLLALLGASLVYLGVFLVGLPALLLARRLGWRSWWTAAALGMGSGALAAYLGGVRWGMGVPPDKLAPLLGAGGLLGALALTTIHLIAPAKDRNADGRG